LDTAEQYFESARELDPEYALAYVGISRVWAGRNQMAITPTSVAVPKQREAILRAVELNDTLTEVYRGLASLKTFGDWDWKGAEKNFLKAIELNPNSADARRAYSHYLMIMKRQDEAMTQIEKALELDPLNPMVRSFYAMVLLYGAHRYDETIEQSQKVLRTVPNNLLANNTLCTALYLKGMNQEAFEAFKSSISDSETIKVIEKDYRNLGFQGVMSRWADRSANQSRISKAGFHKVAMWYALAGKKKEALDWFERGLEERDPNMPYIGLIPNIDGLHFESRFQNLLRRMNFPEDVFERYLEDFKREKP
jgi:tetratricopeptide (TPR) repeat protein